MNHLYYGDNLDVLRDSIAPESVDLIYLDPPFNSKATYNVLFSSPKGHKSEAQIEAFEDTWHWGLEAESTLERLKFINGDLAEFLSFLVGSLDRNDLSAYLVMMAIRLHYMHQCLKDTGSLYLHCDPTASHYLKAILDLIFGVENFRNEVVWKRTNVHNDSKTWSKVSDSIFFYTKSNKFTWNPVYEPHSEDHLSKKYNKKDPGGRRYTLSDMTSPSPRPNMMYEWKGFPHPPNGWRYSLETMTKLDSENRIWYPDDKTKRPRLKRYLDEMKGTVFGNVWTDIFPLNSQAKERLGYPTQKPLALLERMIEASSNEGDVVLDPFCGCGTAVHAAQKLNRNWIGIDITYLAIGLIERRLKQSFPGISFDVIGSPTTIDGAHDLADRDKYQFQWWACALVNAQPYKGKKKGADGGIDGQIFFADYGKSGSTVKKGIVSVKGGKNVSLTMVKDLIATVQGNKAEFGVFVTLTPPTKPMVKEASAAGFFQAGNGRSYPKIQILTIEEILDGKQPEYFDMHLGDLNFKRSQKEKVAAGDQISLPLAT